MTRIAVILPRGMRFSPDGATAIDLCVRDFVLNSRFRAETVVLGEPVARPFTEVDFLPVPRPLRGGQREYARMLSAEAARLEVDLVVVHQHVPSAEIIARAVHPVPVILHRHNAFKRGESVLSRWRQGRTYARFARTVWVSAFCRDAFAAAHPHLGKRAEVVHNGLDLASWKPAPRRAPEVLFVGRASPEKGAVEAAAGAAAALLGQPEWRARFILSRLDGHDDCISGVRSALAPLGPRAEILFDQPHPAVREAFERAAIALVPSIFAEPFGRTALEAMAGGAALLSSLRGGLREVAGDAALALEPPHAATVAEGLQTLIADRHRREALAYAGRERAERLFDIREASRKLDAVYLDILEPAFAPPQRRNLLAEQ